MYLVFDIGGTNMRISISSDGKTIGNSKIVPTPKEFDQGVVTFKQISEELSRGQPIEVVAGGIAGPLDKEKTMLVSTPHVGGWLNKPLKAELEKLFGVPIYLENDADLAALGEATYGMGVNYGIVAYLTISTGVGGGRVVKGKIDENSLGFEPGHQIIVPDGNPCDCGGKGHLESYISGSGIERSSGRNAKDITDPKIWDDIARYLAIGLNNVTVFWSPDVIILGGSVMKSIPLDLVRTYLEEALTIFPQTPKVELAKLGDYVGLYGALSFIKQSRI